MALSQEALSSQIKHLKRAPAPKAPGTNSPTSPTMGAIDLSAVKLKPTGKRQSLIDENMEHHKENSANELNSVFAARKKMFECKEKPATMPRIAPKPCRISEGDDTKKPRSESLPESMTESNEDIKTPTLRPLPTLQSLGLKPLAKPPKPLILTMKIEKKYKNHKVKIAPKVKNAIVKEVENGIVDQGAPRIPSKPPPPQPEEPELIEEETYDDVEQLAEIIKSQQDVPPRPPPLQPQPQLIEEDTYDDVDQIAEMVKSQLGQLPPGANDNIESFDNAESGEFGEEFYQPIEGTFAFESSEAEPPDMDNDEQHPPQLSGQPPSNKESKEDAKAKKERERKERELLKKKEKEETRRKKEEERREKEEKKRKDDERKRKEKVDRELKKTHKLKGNEQAVCIVTAQQDITGTGKDLSYTKGSFLEVVSKENCPNGKWLVRDQQGHYGYVLSDSFKANQTDDSVDENLDEDLYECVDILAIKSSSPPVPSSLPVNNAPDDIYDDTLVEDEDFYDDIPGAN